MHAYKFPAPNHLCFFSVYFNDDRLFTSERIKNHSRSRKSAGNHGKFKKNPTPVVRFPQGLESRHRYSLSLTGSSPAQILLTLEILSKAQIWPLSWTKFWQPLKKTVNHILCMSSLVTTQIQVKFTTRHRLIRKNYSIPRYQIL